MPSADVKHAVEHAASDLAGSLKIPGFRKGKVPMPVLLSRVGKERLMSEAVDSHIGGWFWNAAAEHAHPPDRAARVRLRAAELERRRLRVHRRGRPCSPRPSLRTGRPLEVPAAEPEVPEELVEHELEALRSSVAELVPVEGRGATDGDALVIDVDGAEGEAQRDFVVTLGAGRLLPELEEGIAGMTRRRDEGRSSTACRRASARAVSVTVKEIKEQVLPPLDDELARAASEFDTLDELRADIEGRLREQIEDELEGEFRGAAVDALVEASGVQVSDALVEARAGNLLRAFVTASSAAGSRSRPTSR